MTIVLIFVITAAMLLCMAAAYIKNVIIPNAGLEMTAYDLNLTSTIPVSYTHLTLPTIA